MSYDKIAGLIKMFGVVNHDTGRVTPDICFTNVSDTYHIAKLFDTSFGFIRCGCFLCYSPLARNIEELFFILVADFYMNIILVILTNAMMTRNTARNTQ